MDLMKTIKKAIDPLGIFNPGEVCAVLENQFYFWVVHWFIYFYFL